jgi:hypothetical protein
MINTDCVEVEHKVLETMWYHMWEKVCYGLIFQVCSEVRLKVRLKVFV